MGTRPSSERAVYQAMFELLDGAREPRLGGEAELETAEGRYRFIDGVCFSAPDAGVVGGELAGWLVEAERASAVLTRFRRGAAAVLVRGDGAEPVVLGAASALRAGGAPVGDGFATHEGRLVLVHDDPTPAVAVQAAHDRAAQDDPVIEIGGMVEVELPPTCEPNDLDEVARPTAPPSAAARAVVVSEAIEARGKPAAAADAGSYVAPPVWEIPPLSIPHLDPLPSFPLDALESLDDDEETDPGGRRIGSAGPLVRW